MHKKPIFLIKIGGALITFKDKAYTVDEENLDKIAKEIVILVRQGYQMIIGHGAGSFGHTAAKKYQTHLGILNKQSYRGISEVAYAASSLNQIFVKKLLDLGLNPLSFSPRSFILSKNNQVESVYIDPILEALKNKQIPIVFGDQLLDQDQGCTIYSTEKVLETLAKSLMDTNYQVQKIIHCSRVKGVLDENKNVIKQINSKNFQQIKQNLKKANGADVTGGILHKVEMSLEILKLGIESLIIDGVNVGKLSMAVANKPVVGTYIKD